MASKKESLFPFSKIIICILSSTIIFFVFTILFSYIIFKTSSVQSMYLIYGLIAGGISGFMNGFVLLKFIKEKGIFYGALSGFVQSLICSLIIFVLNKGTAGIGIFILIFIITFLSSIGGVFSVNIKKKIKY